MVISVSVLSSDNVSMNVWIGSPGSLVEQLGVGLETTGFGASSIALVHGVVEFAVRNWQLDVSVWFGSEIWLQICLSERGAPDFANGLVLVVLGSVSVTSELNGSGFVERLLICLKVLCRPFFACGSEVALLLETSSRDFTERSAEFRVSRSTVYETGISWNSVSFQSCWLFLAHVI